MNSLNKLFVLWLFLLTSVVYLGCGGSQKENVNFEPNPFPEPDSTVSNQPEPKTEQPPVEVTEEQPPADQPLRLFTVYFDFDKSSLTPEAKAILAENARTLLAHPDMRIRIEGHCDERGTVEYNLALGERRALSVRNYLVNYGVAPERMTIISYGKERPVDPRHTPEAWAKNRRAEFVELN